MDCGDAIGTDFLYDDRLVLVAQLYDNDVFGSGVSDRSDRPSTRWPPIARARPLDNLHAGFGDGAYHRYIRPSSPSTLIIVN